MTLSTGFFSMSGRKKSPSGFTIRYDALGVAVVTSVLKFLSFAVVAIEVKKCREHQFSVKTAGKRRYFRYCVLKRLFRRLARAV